MSMPTALKQLAWIALISVGTAEGLSAQVVQIEGGPAVKVAPAIPDSEAKKAPARPDNPSAKDAAGAQPKQAEKPPDSSPSTTPKAKTRKARQPTVSAEPGELKARLGEDGKVAFQIKGQPWEEVLEWLAELAVLNLSMDEVPDEACTLVTQSRYTVDEARDVLNGLLLSKGFTLLKHEEILYLVKLDQLDSSRVPRVKPDALDRRGRNEIVKVAFPLESLIATEVENEVKSLLGTHGKVTALKATNRLEVLGTAGSLRDVRDFLAAEQSSQRQLVREFRLEHTRADDVAEMLRKLLGIKEKPAGPMTPEQQQQAMQLAQMQAQQRGNAAAAPAQKEEPEVNLAVNDRNNSILVTGPPDKIAVVEQAVQVIDRPENAPQDGEANGLAAALRRPQVMTYYLSAVPPSLVIKVLQGTGELDPRTRLEADSGTRSIIAYATPKDHGTISAFVKEIDATGRHLEVIQLHVLPADMAAGSIEVLMKGKPKEEDNSRNPFNFYSPRRSNTSDKDPSEEFQIEADVENNRLLIRATEFELAEVKQLLAKLGENPDRPHNASTLRTLQMSPREQESLLRALEQMWPKMTPGSELNILRPPSDSVPEKEKSQDAPPPADDEQDGKSKNVALQSGADAPVDVALAAYALPENDDAPSNVEIPGDQAAPASRQNDDPRPRIPGGPRLPESNGPVPPLTIVPGPNGLVISSPDPELLDRLEQLIAELTPSQAEFTVFYLKKAYAEDVADILKDVFKEGDKDDDSSWNRWWWGFDPSSGSKETTLRLSRRKPLKIIADPLTNSILVRASHDQLAEVRQLLSVLDSAPPSDPETARLLKLIPVYNTTAKEVGAIVEDVFREFLSSGDPARGGGGNRPNVTSRYVMNYNIGGSSSSSAGKMDNVLSVGVDERNNTLIVSAPRELLAEIEEMVARLDAQAQRPKQVIRVLNVPAAGSLKSVQDALNVVVGGKKPSTPKEGEAKQPPQKPGEGQQEAEAQVLE